MLHGFVMERGIAREGNKRRVARSSLHESHTSIYRGNPTAFPSADSRFKLRENLDLNEWNLQCGPRGHSENPSLLK